MQVQVYIYYNLRHNDILSRSSLLPVISFFEVRAGAADGPLPGGEGGAPLLGRGAGAHRLHRALHVDHGGRRAGPCARRLGLPGHQQGESIAGEEHHGHDRAAWRGVFPSCFAG